MTTDTHYRIDEDIKVEAIANYENDQTVVAEYTADRAKLHLPGMALRRAENVDQVDKLLAQLAMENCPGQFEVIEQQDGVRVVQVWLEKRIVAQENEDDVMDWVVEPEFVIYGHEPNFGDCTKVEKVPEIIEGSGWYDITIKARRRFYISEEPNEKIVL